MPFKESLRQHTAYCHQPPAILCSAAPNMKRPVESWSSGMSSPTFICPEFMEPQKFIRGKTNRRLIDSLAFVNKNVATDTRFIAVQKSPLFRDLPWATSRCIACHGRVQNVLRGQPLFRQGDPGSKSFLIIDGQAKVTRVGPFGDVVILWLRGPGSVLGGLNLTPGTRNETGAQATEHCQLVSWDARAMQTFSQRSAILQRNTVSLLTECLDGIQDRFCEMATQKVAVRLARNLIRMHANAGRSAGEVLRIGLTREELAQMTGTTLFAVSRLLCDWTRRGIIDARREEVFVFDIAKLGEMVEDKAKS